MQTLPLLALLAVLHGSPAVVTVSFPVSPDLKLSRAAPNRVTLTSGWGRAVAVPGGLPDPRDPAHYLTRLKPLRFTVPVPPGTRAGSYPARLDADLFLCDDRSGQCYRKTLHLGARLLVGPGSRTTNLRLTVAQLQPSSRARD